jgi:hypothetical protein
MNEKATIIDLITNPFVWFIICIILICIQILGLINMDILRGWLRYGVEEITEVLRLIAEIIYFALGWLFWTFVTFIGYEEKLESNSKIDMGDIAPLPVFFILSLFLWPIAIIAYFSDKRERR